ncbi:MAG TPA: glycoside hydrolase family 43 protein [Gemmatirosa sp.]
MTRSLFARAAALVLAALFARIAVAQPVRGSARVSAGVSVGVTTDARTATADPQFDWFEYAGRDSVFEAARPGPGAYENPIIAGFYPDPSVTRVGGDYYLVNSTFGYYPGIPVWHSRDLVHWTQIGNVIDRPSQLRFDSLPITMGVFAPTIREHAGTFYVVNTCVLCGGNFVVTAKHAAGPWSDPIWLRTIDGIDPSLFFDDDGRVYLLHTTAPEGRARYEGHNAIWMQELDRATLQPVGPHRVRLDAGVPPDTQPRYIEGPHLLKHDGRYYLSAAQGGTEQRHAQVILRAESLWGPYTPGPNNPILTQRTLPPDRPAPVTSTGHADMIETQAGEWWAVFLGVRPYAGAYTFNTGRETFLLPVTWKDGWPFITTDPVPYVHARPRLPREPAAAVAGSVPTSGNFRVRDEFDGPRLAPSWLMIRTPRDSFVDLASTPGTLTLRARPVELSARGQPSYIGHRQQHARATASTAMRYAPAKAGDKAGLAAFQNDDHYYLLAVTLRDGRRVVQLERRAVAPAVAGAAASTPAAPAGPPGGEVLAHAPLDGRADAPVYLKIDARGGRYDFSYGTQPGRWTTLVRDADGTILSTDTAGGFVGATLGLFAYAAP